MKMTVEITNKKILFRTITGISNKTEILIACAFLIAFEFRCSQKI